MAMPAIVPAQAARRVAIVAGPGERLQQLRGPLIAEIAARHHRILAIAPEFTLSDAHALDELGAERAVMTAEASSFKLFADWRAIGALKSVLSAWAPHVVLGCGSRAMIHAALAARGAGAERVVVIVDALPEHRFSGTVAPDEMPAWRYRQALRAADAAIFYNREDAALLTRLGIMPAALPTAIVAGAGVDVGEHGLVPLPSLNNGLVFLMAAPSTGARACSSIARRRARCATTRPTRASCWRVRAARARMRLRPKTFPATAQSSTSARPTACAARSPAATSSSIPRTPRACRSRCSRR